TTETALSYLRRAQVSAYMPDQCQHAQRHDDDIESVKPDAEFIPVGTQDFPQPGEAETPYEGSDKGIEVEARERHAGNARRQGDKCTHHRQHAGEQDDDVAVALEPALGQLQIT